MQLPMNSDKSMVKSDIKEPRVQVQSPKRSNYRKPIEELIWIEQLSCLLRTFQVKSLLAVRDPFLPLSLPPHSRKQWIKKREKNIIIAMSSFSTVNNNPSRGEKASSVYCHVELSLLRGDTLPIHQSPSWAGPRRKTPAENTKKKHSWTPGSSASAIWCIIICRLNQFLVITSGVHGWQRSGRTRYKTHFFFYSVLTQAFFVVLGVSRQSARRKKHFRKVISVCQK